MLPILLKTALFALVASLSIPFLLPYLLPAIKFISFDLLPALSRLQQELLTPRNLFFLLNFIIFTLFAAFQLQQHGHHSQLPAAARRRGTPRKASSSLKPIRRLHDQPSTEEDHDHSRDYSEPAYNHAADNSDAEFQDADSDLSSLSAIAAAADNTGMREDAADELTHSGRPLPSARFKKLDNHHSKSSLGINHTRRSTYDTMESTWKAITFGDRRPISLNRSHVHRRPETMKNMHTEENRETSSDSSCRPLTRTLSSSSNPLSRKNSLTSFKPFHSSNSRLRVRREPSISSEELNAKVESFISRFNEQMRLQRQQSLLRYMQTVQT